MTRIVKVPVAKYRVDRTFEETFNYAEQSKKIGDFLGSLAHWDQVQENYKLTMHHCREPHLDCTTFIITADMTEKERTLFLLKYGTTANPHTFI